jgi:2-keto-4-pentenoate hydratase/2-oxohepta-3-ene-1,7-dioic acid hydratase in catechol pathway
VKWARIEVGGAPLKVSLRDRSLVADDGRSFPLAGAKFLPPVMPGNFYAAGLNFRAHIEWANRHHGTSYRPPTQADIGYRSNNALIGSGAEIVIPADSGGPVEYEGELVAVIGRKAKNVTEAEALDCVAGYTLGNDVSERTWQRSDRTLWRAKNADTFKPMGPFVVSGIDPMNQEIEVRINGSTVSRYNTRGMIFGVAHYLSRMSRYVTLYPDDVIWLGCDGHTVPALKEGDVVEVANEAIGILSNRVVRAN